MITLNIEDALDELEKKYDYNLTFYSTVQEWIDTNNPNKKSEEQLLTELNLILQELYELKKSYTVKSGLQTKLENKVLEILDSHLDIEVENVTTLKF